MNKGIRYSIIYAVIRPEITERLSVGMVILNGDSVEVRYSDNKLKALELLMARPVYQFVGRMVRDLNERQVIKGEADLEYLSRYSNNLITVSPVQTVDLEPTPAHKEWLYRKYISA